MSDSKGALVILRPEMIHVKCPECEGSGIIIDYSGEGDGYCFQEDEESDNGYSASDLRLLADKIDELNGRKGGEA